MSGKLLASFRLHFFKVSVELVAKTVLCSGGVPHTLGSTQLAYCPVPLLYCSCDLLKM